MIQLSETLKEHGLRQSELAVALGVSKTALSRLAREGRPVQRLQGREEEVTAWLTERGVPQSEAEQWHQPAGPAPSSEQPDSAGVRAEIPEDTDMLIAAQRLTLEEREALGLPRDPFNDEVASHADLYLPPRHRLVREAMWQCAQHRGFIAVVGESGSGKTMLRRDVIARAQTEDPSVIPILPYVLGMEEHDRRGPSLRATDIAEMIVRRLEPSARLRSSRMGRYHQAEEVLSERVRSGQKPVLIIEEAHALPKATLRHLKRFSELEIGYARLLGIILIGQNELGDRLSETDPSIREVVQRCEVLRLPPLADERQIGDYLRHKFARAGANLDSVIDPSAIEAIRDRLTIRPRAGGEHRSVSLCYPLAVQNLLVIALRAALEIGRFSRLSREHVEAV